MNLKPEAAGALFAGKAGGASLCESDFFSRRRLRVCYVMAAIEHVSVEARSDVSYSAERKIKFSTFSSFSRKEKVFC